MPDAELNDSGKLIERCLSKDLTAWAVFVSAYSPLISAAIVNRLKLYGFRICEHDVADIRQQLLTTLWEENKLAELKNPGSLSYWIAITAGNAALAWVRRKKNMANRSFVPLSYNMDGLELGDTIASDSPDPRSESSYNELTDKISQAMETFSDQEKIVLKLHIFHNKRYDDIAEILSMPPGTVSSYIKRAKDKLKDRLREFHTD